MITWIGHTLPRACGRRLRSSSVVWITALDELQGRLRALGCVAGRNMIGIARQHDQLRIQDRLLPGARLVYASQPAALCGDHQRRAGDLRHIGPNVSAGDSLHKTHLGRDGGAAHEGRPPGDALWRKRAAETAGHALPGPGLDTLLLKLFGEGRHPRLRTDAIRRWRPDDGQRAHALGTASGEGPRDGATDLGPDEMEALDAQRVHEAAEVVDDEVQAPGELARH